MSSVRDEKIVGVIALHAIWSRDSQLCVWGEDSGLPARAPKRRGRRPAKPRPHKHPFACSGESLAGALDALAIPLKPDAQIERELRLMLPSFDDGPQHSPQLLRADEDRHPDDPGLLDPWVVPGIGLPPAEGNAPEAVVGDLLGAVVDACARSFLAGGLVGRRGRCSVGRGSDELEVWHGI